MKTIWFAGMLSSREQILAGRCIRYARAVDRSRFLCRRVVENVLKNRLLDVRTSVVARISRTHWRRMFAAVASASLTAALLVAAGSPVHAEPEPDTWAQQIAITPGVNTAAQLPVTVELPAPSAGRRVTRLTFRWPQRVPPEYYATSSGSFPVDASHCEESATCTVTATIPTARYLANSFSSISLAVTGVEEAGEASTEVLLGSRSFSPRVVNPKPTAVLTSPSNQTAVWGPVTVTADATASSVEAPVQGVRFYTRVTGRETDTYFFDDTAPYSVDLDALDIADAGRSGYVYAIAEDVHGVLSDAGTDTTFPYRRQLRVAPPTEAQFATPTADRVPAGGRGNPALIGYRVRVPDVVPHNDANPAHITRVEVLIDDQPWLNMPWDRTTWYHNGSKVRAASINMFWHDQTPGVHVAEIRAHTNYGGLGVTRRVFTVNDGVTFSAPTINGTTLREGHLLTAATGHRVATTATGVVAHAALSFWDFTASRGSASLTTLPNGCHSSTYPAGCPDSVRLVSTYTTPRQPGRYTLTWSAQAAHDRVERFTRAVVVRARGVAAIRTARTRVNGRPAVVATGRVTRLHDRSAARGAQMTLQWRPVPSAARPSPAWRTVSSSAPLITNIHGVARTRWVLPSGRGGLQLRWIAAATGTGASSVSGATSHPARVR